MPLFLRLANLIIASVGVEFVNRRLDRDCKTWFQDACWPRMRKVFVLLMAACSPWLCSGAAFDHEHRAFGAVLERHVAGGLVDYAGLKKEAGPLRAYLDRLGEVSATEFNGWTTNEQIAFLINLYNAATLKLVADHYPVKSIKNIGGLFRSPWKLPVVRAFGETLTLDDVEYAWLLGKHREPRIHFALVCAALGCPELRREPFIAARLGEQLEDQGRRFLSDTNKNRIDVAARTAHLSPIFKWFAADFEGKSGSVIEFVRPYFTAAVQEDLRRQQFKISYTRYDWRLNERTRPR